MNHSEKTLSIKVDISEDSAISLNRVMNEFTEKFKNLTIIGNNLYYTMGIDISEKVNSEIREAILEVLDSHHLSYTNLRYENNLEFSEEKKYA